MTIILDQIASELSIVKAQRLDCDWNRTFQYCQLEFKDNSNNYKPTDDDIFLRDITVKLLKRGIRPFPSFELEKNIVQLYGKEFQIQLKPQDKKGAIEFTFNASLQNYLENFDDFVDPWEESIDLLSFDPSQPANEKIFFAELRKKFGSKIVNFIQMQVPISNIVKPEDKNNFLSQRVDFLLNFPNGKSLIIEPGDHNELGQQARDSLRDKASSAIGIPTLRFENSHIDKDFPYASIKKFLDQNDCARFLRNDHQLPNKLRKSLNNLVLLPTLIARVEFLLCHFFFEKGLIHQSSLAIGVVERDLECAVLALSDFKSLVFRLCSLYGIPFHFPETTLFIQRITDDVTTDFSNFEFNPKYVDSLFEHQLDLILDVGIKCNPNTISLNSGALFIGAVRRTYSNNNQVRFDYLSWPRTIVTDENTEPILTTFLQDFFRKWKFRDGQVPIINNILLQKDTIGLLPTSAGKSICFQLTSILTPGTTLVIDPITALMKNQVETLKETYGISRSYAWYGTSSKQIDMSEILSGYIMVFISPERLLRDSFRKAMTSLVASDIFINYAVVDEAHCLSMWGHDFRPSYLMLESNIRHFCTFRSIKPPIIALTGTASQLVLIDLRRELNIDDLNSIIRPKSFNRPELHYNLIKCNTDDKQSVLVNVERSTARKLNVQDLSQEATGIVFAYTPKELWELLSFHLGDTLGHVNKVLNAKDHDEIRFGVYSGSAPKEFPAVNGNLWDDYKDKVLDLFQRGAIRMLFGNKAISVGLDNSKINYIINYKMPQSIEEYYQMIGRAGRDGQDSECYLIFSDDNPHLTNQWLDRQIPRMEKRYDDLGIISYYHEDNFPGKMVDTKGTQQVFTAMTRKPTDAIVLTANMDGNFSDVEAKRTEKYVSYLFMLGIIESYEVVGIGVKASYKITLAKEVQNFLQSKDQNVLEWYLIKKITEYLNRYKPISYEQVHKTVVDRKEPHLSGRCIGYLIDFIYDQIEYQRREAIRTMVNFCNEKDTGSERLRSRIVAYFNSSEKYSEILLQMANSQLVIPSVIEIIKKVDDFEDAELLYYETRRLLDERLRPDWLAVNIFALIFREKGQFSKTIGSYLLDLRRELANEPGFDDAKVHEFITVFLSQIRRLDNIFEEELSFSFISHCIIQLAENVDKSYLATTSHLDLPEDERSRIELLIANYQVKEILNAHYSRIIN